MKPNVKENRRISKRISYWLRHRPDLGGLVLDKAGWVEVSDLLKSLKRDGVNIDRPRLDEVVADNDKRRFEFDDSGTSIRARQGHSVEIDLGYSPTEPPEWLFHGTASRNVESIRERGLHRASHHHVHLSTNAELMLEVARRHGKPVLIRVAAGRMHEEGHSFFLTANDVWLAESVPPEYTSKSNLAPPESISISQ